MNPTTDSAAQAAMYGGAATTLMFWGMNVSEWAAVISAGVALAGGVVHIWSLLQRNKREIEVHRLKMESFSVAKALDESSTERDA